MTKLHTIIIIFIIFFCQEKATSADPVLLSIVIVGFFYCAFVHWTRQELNSDHFYLLYVHNFGNGMNLVFIALFHVHLSLVFFLLSKIDENLGSNPIEQSCRRSRARSCHLMKKEHVEENLEYLYNIAITLSLPSGVPGFFSYRWTESHAAFRITNFRTSDFSMKIWTLLHLTCMCTGSVINTIFVFLGIDELHVVLHYLRGGGSQHVIEGTTFI
ncbi:hypothetical protein ACJX0J_029898, partial [Zea mays]